MRKNGMDMHTFSRTNILSFTKAFERRVIKLSLDFFVSNFCQSAFLLLRETTEVSTFFSYYDEIVSYQFLASCPARLGDKTRQLFRCRKVITLKDPFLLHINPALIGTLANESRNLIESNFDRFQWCKILVCLVLYWPAQKCHILHLIGFVNSEAVITMQPLSVVLVWLVVGSCAEMSESAFGSPSCVASSRYSSIY